jgi:hypothetical protein
MKELTVDRGEPESRGLRESASIFSPKSMEEKCTACPKSGSTLELEGSWVLLIRRLLR